MALPLYLAMTAAEAEGCQTLPEHFAWMACHFSSYGLGLSNLPRQLPKGSLLILNDRTPVDQHDPNRITEQLAQAVEELTISGVLLDFQRPENPQTAAIARTVTSALSCPVAVTECYARDLECPVFLEAPRGYHSLQSRVRPWEGRPLWLEASFGPGTVTVTQEGSRYSPQEMFPPELPICRDEGLKCSYCIETAKDSVRYHFWRTAQDLKELLELAQSLGITQAIGLYQELGPDWEREE